MLVTINDNEEVEVGDDTNENFYTWITSVNDSAFRCSACRVGTIHNGYSVRVINAMTDEQENEKRVYTCTNCGKTMLK